MTFEEKLTAILGNKITELRFANNGFGNDGAIAIAAALANNSSLTSLNLESNRIGSAGVIAITRLLETNSSLG